MAPSRIDAAETCDVFVVGAGLAGLAAAIGFARAGRRVVSAGASERLGQGRTVALLGPSVDFLDQLGVWPAVAPRAAPMRGLRIVDDTGSLFAPPPVEFRAREIGREVFGWNVENAALADALEAAAAAHPDLVRIDGQRRRVRFHARARHGHARRRTRLRRRAGRRRGRARFAVAARRRDCGPRAPLPSERADRRARPRAPARRFLDRVSHPPGAVHAGAPACGARRAQPLEPGLGDERSGSEAARRARRRRSRRGDRAPGALAARGDANRGRTRALPARAPKRQPLRRDPAGAGRRRGARLPADRRAGAQPGPA